MDNTMPKAMSPTFAKLSKDYKIRKYGFDSGCLTLWMRMISISKTQIQTPNYFLLLVLAFASAEMKFWSLLLYTGCTGQENE